MAIENHIRNPVEWSGDQLVDGIRALGRAGRALHAPSRGGALPTVGRIGLADIRDALARGYDDLGTYRTDAMFLAAIYPIAGLVLAWVTLNHGMLPLVFPLAAGFALIGPLAALGLYQLSRQRERTLGGLPPETRGAAAPGPAVGSIVALGLVMLAIFALWLAVAYGIYMLTLGPEAPVSASAFVHDVFMTGAGWAMIVIGIGVGFLFAALVLTIGVVSFPLMLDRDIGPLDAVRTSVRSVVANPVPMAAWGAIVAIALVVGSIPALIGLVIVMPVLGHATWHLYRKVVMP
jgi:uncharacterized membrane protein